MKRKPCVWILEKIHTSGEWIPTGGMFDLRSYALWGLRQWQRNNPNDRFRVAKYVREK